MRLKMPCSTERAISIFYAGDDPQSKAAVCNLIVKLGFDAVDAGPLQNARYLEPLSLLNIHLGRVLGLWNTDRIVSSSSRLTVWVGQRATRFESRLMICRQDDR